MVARSHAQTLTHALYSVACPMEATAVNVSIMVACPVRGPQAMNVGVALPSFMFAKDKKAAPVVLLALVGCGILLPLVAVSWYMFNANKFTGPNNVMHETLAIFLTSKYNVKESQVRCACGKE